MEKINIFFEKIFNITKKLLIALIFLKVALFLYCLFVLPDIFIRPEYIDTLNIMIALLLYLLPIFWFTGKLKKRWEEILGYGIFIVCYIFVGFMYCVLCAIILQPYTTSYEEREGEIFLVEHTSGLHERHNEYYRIKNFLLMESSPVYVEGDMFLDLYADPGESYYDKKLRD